MQRQQLPVLLVPVLLPRVRCGIPSERRQLCCGEAPALSLSRQWSAVRRVSLLTNANTGTSCKHANPVHCAVFKPIELRPTLQELRQRLLLRDMFRRLPAHQLQHLLSSKFSQLTPVHAHAGLQPDPCELHVWGCRMYAATLLPMSCPAPQCGITCSLYADSGECACQQQCQPGWQLSGSGACFETKSNSPSTAVIAGAAVGAAAAVAGGLSQVWCNAPCSVVPCHAAASWSLLRCWNA